MSLEDRKVKRAVCKALEKIKATLTKGWCKGAYARDTNGDLTNYTRSDACSWCIMGAVWLHTKPPFQEIKRLRLGYEISKTLEQEGVSIPAFHKGATNRLIYFNDIKCHSADEAIEIVEKTIQRLKTT